GKLPAWSEPAWKNSGTKQKKIKNPQITQITQILRAYKQDGGYRVEAPENRHASESAHLF
ncbi:MAG TPA: hypothetical protein VE641_14535, partial [Chthoniobacterales bacterium]|nr:hypothetical protein [Chthoniobacterales bacterium]